MQRRLLIIALVFVAGFGVGYGITWLLVGSGDRQGPQGEREARIATRGPGGESDARGAATRTGRDEDATGDAPGANDDDDARTGQDAGAAGAAPGDALVNTEATATTAPGADTLTPADGAPVAPTPAWEACVNRVCRIDFGRVSGGISIRKGRLEHRQPVDWDRDFGRADKVGTLEAGRDVRVEVLAVGLGDGLPTAAYIVRKTRRDEVRGVIALRIGDKSLELVPVE